MKLVDKGNYESMHGFKKSGYLAKKAKQRTQKENMRGYGEECVEPRHQNVDDRKQDILHRRKNTEQRKMADLERNNENEQNISHNNQNKSSKCWFLDFVSERTE